MHHPATGLDRGERFRLSLTETGMAMLCGALLAQMAVVTSLDAHRDLAWSWLTQLAGIAVGIGLGALAGWRTLARRRRRRPPHRVAA